MCRSSLGKSGGEEVGWVSIVDGDPEWVERRCFGRSKRKRGRMERGQGARGVGGGRWEAEVGWVRRGQGGVGMDSPAGRGERVVGLRWEGWRRRRDGFQPLGVGAS